MTYSAETEKPGGGGGGLSNELSAPYEVPQFPIEKIESKMAAAAGGRPEPRHENSEEVVVPHYQRVSASGDDVTGVPIEDLKAPVNSWIQTRFLTFFTETLRLA